MKTTFVFLVAIARLALSLPAKNAPEEVQARDIIIDKPTNFYIEKDLDPLVSATLGGTVTVVRWGPFEVPAMGMLDNNKAYNVKKPCEDCYITAMQGDLQFEDGRSANVEDGAWLHHMVLYTGLGWTPGSKIDLVCSYTLLSAFLGWAHRIFASGNERTPVRLNTKYKFGMAVDKGDNFHILYDLVNISPNATKYYIAMTFEHVPKTTPGYKPAQMLWMDVTGCGASEAKPQEGIYELRSPGWNSSISGVMLSTLGHVHDGGVYTTLLVNEKPVCRSDQFYGTKPAFFEKVGVTNLSSDKILEAHGMNSSSNDTKAQPMNMQHPQGHDRNMNSKQESPNLKALEHVSESSSCVNFGVLQKGDNVEVVATYDTQTHYLNRNMMHEQASIFDLFKGGNDPKYASIMGINPFYIGEGQMSL